MAFFVLTALIATSYVRGQNPNLVGRKVVTKYKTPLRVGDNVVNNDGEFRVFTVERVNGDWLWVVEGSVSGWVRSVDVVPFEKSVEFYTRQIQASPDSASAAHSYLCRGAIHDRNGETDAALADFNAALRLVPTYVAAFNNRGIIWDKKSAHDKAIADFTEALRLRPNYVAAVFNRADSWSSKKEYERAIADFSEAIRLDPKLARAFFGRGLAWNESKRYDLAIPDLTEAIRLDPTTDEVHYQRGIALLSSGSYDAAVADFTEHLRRHPTRPEAFANRGTAWKLKGEYEKALADLDKAVGLAPKNTVFLYKRGMARLESGDDDKAIADFNEVIRRDPKAGMIVAGLARGTAWGHKREYEKAVSDFKEVVRLDPLNDSALNNLAYIWATCPDARFRDGRRAVESATRACELSQEEVPTFLATLAAAHGEAGDFDKAVRCQEKANKLFTDDEEKKNGEKQLALYKQRQPYHDD
jgi:tetratricopeptide (TPR) repeat protein